MEIYVESTYSEDLNLNVVDLNSFYHKSRNDSPKLEIKKKKKFPFSFSLEKFTDIPPLNKQNIGQDDLGESKNTEYNKKDNDDQANINYSSCPSKKIKKKNKKKEQKKIKQKKTKKKIKQKKNLSNINLADDDLKDDSLKKNSLKEKNKKIIDFSKSKIKYDLINKKAIIIKLEKNCQFFSTKKKKFFNPFLIKEKNFKSGIVKKIHVKKKKIL